MSKKSFVKGAAILGIAGIIVKLLGAVFRLPLGNMIGATGMSYYTPAYYIYTIFVVIATSGIPVAISKMVSERITVKNYEEAHRVFRYSMYLMLSIGIVSFGILFFGAGWLSNINGIPESKYSMMAVAPALLVVPVMAAYRGYFQGMQNMKPTAVSQIIEQFFRVGFGLFLAYTLFKAGGSIHLFSKYGSQSGGAAGAAGATFGATIGSLAGLLVILLIYKLSKKAIKHRITIHAGGEREEGKTIMRNILLIAVPITIGAAIMPIMNFAEVPIIVNRLTATGWTPDVAKNLYGQIGGLATPIINLPQVLTMALAMSLVPAISSRFKEGDMEGLRSNTTLGMRIALIIGLPCALGIAVLSQPIMLLLFPTRASEAISVAPTLSILAIGVIFLSVVQTVSGILQGVGKQMVPVKNLCVGIVIKIVLTWVLVGIPSLNIKGAAIGTCAAYLVVAVLDVYGVKKYTGAKFDIMLTYVKPLISSLVMAAVAWLTYYKLLSGGEGDSLKTLLAVFVAAVVYVVMLFVTRSITREDLENMPGGDKILRLAQMIKRR
ncbi:MAG: putative polysaccharide biosynthesis protein [Anaerovoracaceae bacterium]|jgi:stage V sporulation protein B